MKRTTALILAFLMLVPLCLTGCGDSSGQTQVPDSFVEATIPNIIANDENLKNNYNNYSNYSIIYHSTDQNAHFDVVGLEIIYPHAYGTRSYFVSCRYQYSKADDTWTLLAQEPAEFYSVWLDPEKAIGLTAEIIDYSYRGFYGSCTVTDVDSDNMILTVQFSVYNETQEPIFNNESIKVNIEYDNWAMLCSSDFYINLNNSGYKLLVRMALSGSYYGDSGLFVFLSEET